MRCRKSVWDLTGKDADNAQAFHSRIYRCDGTLRIQLCRLLAGWLALPIDRETGSGESCIQSR